MKVVVFGAGAVGSLFGARFAAAGHAVVLLGRPDHLAAIRERGLRVEGVGEGTFRLDVADDPRVAHDAEAVLLTVKTFDLPEAARALARSCGPRPTLLTQNGLGIEAPALAALQAGGWTDPDRWLVRAVHSVPATWVEAGVVRAAGAGEVVLPRAGAPGPLHGPVGPFLELFASSGFTVREAASLEPELWRKAVVNAAINPVTALHGVPNGAVLEGPLREEALALLGEAVRVARAEGMELTEREAIEDFERVARATSRNRSSMLQDVDRGRPTEVDAILGEIVRRAKRHRLAAPASRAAIAALEALVARGPAAP